MASRSSRVATVADMKHVGMPQVTSALVGAPYSVRLVRQQSHDPKGNSEVACANCGPVQLMIAT
jgi:hypothetical protein